VPSLEETPLPGDARRRNCVGRKPMMGMTLVIKVLPPIRRAIRTRGTITTASSCMPLGSLKP
jgi:hypothetical protein